MARNEEKQQGRLNRLWLQKEREEGRIKDVHERRPKLCTLNTASSVKKWIPSIKSEIEYYLQQSQLPHYPERKIAEFKLCIEALEKEYKRFITKLRVLDPSCKNKPWTPRAYSKRRTDMRGFPGTAKKPYCEPSSPLNRDESDLVRKPIGSHQTSAEGLVHLSQSDTKPRVHVTIGPTLQSPDIVDQDKPLFFDRTRLAVAVAGFRGCVGQPGFSETQELARMLHASLPNLSSATRGQAPATHAEDTAGVREKMVGCVGGQMHGVRTHKTILCSVMAPAERTPERPYHIGATEQNTGHVPGLGIYSSSDEELDT